MHLYCRFNEQDATRDTARLLIDAYPEALLTRGSLGRLPLHMCSGYNKMAVVKVLLEANPDAAIAKQSDDKGDVPMHLYCCSTEQDATRDTARLLIDAYPEALLTKGNLGRLPLDMRSHWQIHKMTVVKVV